MELDKRNITEAYNTHRSQFIHRYGDENWRLSLSEWTKAWIDSGKFTERGRSAGCYAMYRLDSDKPISPDNYLITNRAFAPSGVPKNKVGYKESGEANRYFIFKFNGKSYQTLKEIKREYGFSAGRINYLRRCGEITKWAKSVAVRLYKTPFGIFSHFKEALNVVRNACGKFIASRTLYNRFGSKSFPDYEIFTVNG